MFLVREWWNEVLQVWMRQMARRACVKKVQGRREQSVSCKSLATAMHRGGSCLLKVGFAHFPLRTPGIADNAGLAEKVTQGMRAESKRM